jgi:ubiquinone/menaquinone biosynthesis C-methylase UbiE
VSDDKISEIRDCWERSATIDVDSDGLRPTARDPYLQEILEKSICNWIYPEARILDVGCGDGTSTFRFASIADLVLGIDYIEDFTKKAKKLAETQKIGNVIFETGNVLDLSRVRDNYGPFDICITIRCLINLPEWSKQSQALKEIAACIRKGGLYLTSEGWADGMDGLNLARRRLGLKPMKIAPYNLLISREQFEDEIQKYFEFLGYVNLGLYLFISRVLQPAYVFPQGPKHTHLLNQIAAQMVSAGVGAMDFSYCDYAGVYILRRKE